MVSMIRGMVFVGVLFFFSNVMAEDAAVTQELEKAPQVAEAVKAQEIAIEEAPVIVADATKDVSTSVVAPAKKMEENAVQIADAGSEVVSEEVPQVAALEEEILEAAEKALAEDPATQLATAEDGFNLDFEDFEYDELEEGA